MSTFNASTHNGFITVHNPSTGNHRTFKIWTKRQGSLKGKRIVSMLTGPDRDNFDNWKAFGFAGDNGVSVWHSQRGTNFEKFAKILSNAAAFESKLGVQFMCEGRCRACNRPLTTPESIASGLGPICGGR